MLQVLLCKPYKLLCHCSQKIILIFIYNALFKNGVESYLWGQRTYGLAHALLGPRAHAEEGICRGRIGKGRSARGTAEDDPVLGIPRFQREKQHLVECCPQKAP